MISDMALPLSGPARLRALEAAWYAISVDAARQVERMVGNGWPRDEAVAAVREDMTAWLAANITAAVEFGAGWAEVLGT